MNNEQQLKREIEELEGALVSKRAGLIVAQVARRAAMTSEDVHASNLQISTHDELKEHIAILRQTLRSLADKHYAGEQSHDDWKAYHRATDPLEKEIYHLMKSHPASLYINILGLPREIEMAIVREGKIKDIPELLQLSDGDLLNIEHIGPTRLAVIEAHLEHFRFAK